MTFQYSGTTELLDNPQIDNTKVFFVEDDYIFVTIITADEFGNPITLTNFYHKKYGVETEIQYTYDLGTMSVEYEVYK